MSSFLNGIVTLPLSTAMPLSASRTETSSKIVYRVYCRTCFVMSLMTCRLLRSGTSAANAAEDESAKASAIRIVFLNMMDSPSPWPPGRGR